MRRSLFAGIGVAAVLMLAACSPDQPRREPLAPADAGLAKGGGGGGGGGSPLCAGGGASEISKLQKKLFTVPAELAAIEEDFDAINDACPITSAESEILTDYIETMIGFSDAPILPPDAANRAGDLVSLLAQVTAFATGLAEVRSASIFQSQGGAAVLSPGESMTTWNHQARLEVQAATLPDITVPSRSHLWTFEPAPGQCAGITSLRVTGNCYQIHDYPDEGTTAYDPPFIVTLCHPSHSGPGESNAGIGHQVTAPGAFNGKAEVLQEVVVPTFVCEHSEANSWLRREAGPLGRAVATAYDFLRPRPLFALDAGESGLGLFTSLFGEVLNDVFKDDFNDPTTFNAQVSQPPPAVVTDTPDLGDGNWTFKSQTPGYIRIQSALGDMSGGDVLAISQGQGACTNCPVFRLLGTRIGAADGIGSYRITWTSLQSQPSVKEAPFVILNAISPNNNSHNTNLEIARLSYVTVPPSQNKLLFTVRGDGVSVPDTTFDVGNWVRDVSQKFTVTVNLTMLNSSLNQTISLSIGDPPVPTAVVNRYAPKATSLKQIGYVLAGIDAGVIGSKTWTITRLSDVPPQ